MATNLYINWTSCSFTPAATGTPAPIAKITDVKIAKGGSPERFKGDLSVFAMAAAVPDRTRTITVTTGDIPAALAIVQGTVGAFTVALADAINGVTAGGGAVTYALATCVVVSNNADGAHGKFATAQIVFEGYAANGTSDMLSATPIT